MSKLSWKKCNNDYISSSGDFVFKLTYQDIGLYSSGKCYSLQTRKLDESKFEYLHYAFVVQTDGHHVEKRHGVGDKLWTDVDEIITETENILFDNLYIR